MSTSSTVGRTVEPITAVCVILQSWHCAGLSLATQSGPTENCSNSLRLSVFASLGLQTALSSLPPLRFALPASLAYRPKPSWLGRSPGRASTGPSSFSGSPCFARQFRRERNWTAASDPKGARQGWRASKLRARPCAAPALEVSFRDFSEIAARQRFYPSLVHRCDARREFVALPYCVFWSRPPYFTRSLACQIIRKRKAYQNVVASISHHALEPPG